MVQKLVKQKQAKKIEVKKLLITKNRLLGFSSKIEVPQLGLT